MSGKQKDHKYWNARTQRWECGNPKSNRYKKAAKDQSGKPGIKERIVSRLLFGGPDGNSAD